MSAALVDTSVFVGLESGRRLDVDLLPDDLHVSVVTVAEIEAGVLSAPDTQTRSRRMQTLQRAAALVPLSVDQSAASHWAHLRVALREAGRSVGVNDLWIAAIAVAHALPVVTQDDDFDVLADLDLLEVVKV